MPEKNQPEKPTPEQLKKVKTHPKPEKKEKYPFPIEPEEKEDSSNGSLTEESLPSDDIEAPELEEICGNIWVCLYQIGGLLKKDFEPLTPDIKKLLEPPSARLAKKYHVEKMMSDEIMLAGILGVDITKRFLKKPKKEKEEKGSQIDR